MKKLLALGLTFCLLPTVVFAAELDTSVEKTAAYLLERVPDPQVGSIGGEWAVIGLARSGYDVPQTYWDNYYQTVVDYVTDREGVLHEKKYTDYSRVVLALTAIGADPTNVGEYNLLTPLGDYDKTVWQGTNGAIWALIALDSANYTIPQNPEAETQATRQLYVNSILDSQLPDGGWSLTSNAAYSSDPDITGMALQALSNYQNQPEVVAATQEALDCLSQMQDEKGGYSSWDTSNLESATQVLVGLTALGMDERAADFVKNKASVLDNILSFGQSDGSFAHAGEDEKENQMSTEQGLCAMVAVQRARKGQPNFYDMSDVTITVTGVEKPLIGLVGKNPAVQKMPLMDAGITFPDIAGNQYEAAVLGLAGRAIINGNADGNFYPGNTMTRAEFATIVVKTMGLAPQTVEQFTDVPQTAWFAPYVGTAFNYGIVNGNSATTFNPQGTITRQEAAVMVARAAKLCGMETDYNTQAVRDSLAGFMDYVTVAEFAQSSVAFCYDNEILDPWVMDIKPTEAITRGEIAQMLYNLLDVANLL